MQMIEPSLQDGQMLFDKYQVERFLGKGSFGEVYLVNDSTNNANQKALKIIFNRNLETDTSNEIDLLKMIDCPNVIKYYDHILHDRKMFYFFIEYCAGGDLKQAIDQANQSKTKLEPIRDWSMQILNGIQYLHSRSIIHRDIKPENIFIGEGGVLKIGDLGIARDLHSFTRMGNTFAGTDYYMSPEVINQEVYNEKIDVWSYGCVVYEMLTLQKAFDGKNQPAVFEAILKSEPVIPSHATQEIVMIIKNCLKKNAKERVSSVQLFDLLNKKYTTPERIDSARSISGWEPAGICVQVMTGHTSPTQALTMGPDNMLISGSVDDTIKLWNLESGECLKTLEVGSPTNTMAMSQSGHLISGDMEGSIKIWDLTSGEIVKSVREYRFSIYSLVITRNNQIITGSDNFDGRIKVWDMESLQVIRVMNDHNSFVRRLVLKDNVLISGSKDTTIQLYDIDKGELLRTLSDHKDMIMTLTITREGYLASGSGDGCLKIWDLEAGVCVRDIGRCSNGFITSILGNRGELIYSSWDGSIKFMDTRNGKLVKTIKDAHNNSVTSMTIDNKGRLITGAGDKEIKVWEI